MFKFLYISFFGLFIFTGLQAQQKVIYEDSTLLQQENIAAPVEDIITYDSTVSIETYTEPEEDELAPDTTLLVNSLYLPYDSIKNWKKLKGYEYNKYLDSLLRAEEQKEVKPVSRSYSGGGFLNNILGSGFFSLLLWSLAIFFVLFILYRLFLADSIFKRRSQKTDAGAEEIEEKKINSETDFDALIRAALVNNNYRQAVRYQYLRTLHTLAEKNFISLAPDKTNYHYVRELTGRAYQNDFAALTLNYEYVWYGEFEIDKPIYQKIENAFNNLNQKV